MHYNYVLLSNLQTIYIQITELLGNPEISSERESGQYSCPVTDEKIDLCLLKGCPDKQQQQQD